MSEMLTLLVGAMVKIDAEQGTITMIEDATRKPQGFDFVSLASKI